MAPNVQKFNALDHAESVSHDLGACLLRDAGLVVLEHADRHLMPSLHDPPIATPSNLLAKTQTEGPISPADQHLGHQMTDLNDQPSSPPPATTVPPPPETTEPPSTPPSEPPNDVPKRRFDPSRTIGIIKRKALIKDLAAVYHAECLAYCRELLELQRKCEEILDRHIRMLKSEAMEHNQSYIQLSEAKDS
ncbi:hypothetical protein CTI12_AA606330 [Artemisia annua]|uniref:Uncharacterized protein n=1 Tax=Artemisia annua TaxID=35608 RepID=A0A2U1KGN1_ARTAN|nr:hypothetical protein CTI12_AA606330 [Artemisia annua]